MQRLSLLPDGALLDRIEHLERTEHDLQQSAMARVSFAEAEGAWSDPQYRDLSSVLMTVRENLLETENEFLRRDALGLERVA